MQKYQAEMATRLLKEGKKECLALWLTNEMEFQRLVRLYTLICSLK
jgi:hypothetical protein